MVLQADVFVCEWVGECVSVCVCVYARGAPSANVFVRFWVSEWVSVSVSVSVCV
jgi:hypothetical protein